MGIHILNGGGSPGHVAAGNLADEIKELIYKREGTMPVAAVIGVLEIVKFEVMNEQ